MPKKMIKVRAKKACFWDEKTRPEGKEFSTDISNFPIDDETKELVFPRHLEPVGEYEISDEEIAAEAKKKADKEDAEKAALLQEAKNLNIKGVGPHWGLDSLRKAVEKERLEIESANADGGN